VREVLERAARGEFPPADGVVEVVGPPPGRAMAVVAFTAHHVVATSAPESWVRERVPDRDLLAPMRPAFLAALGRELGRRCDSIDVVLAAPGLDGEPELAPVARDEHPRVARALAHREDVRAFADPTGAATVVLGRGLALRTEVAFEVAEAARGRGLATRALLDARRLADPGEALFAQCSPGNAASLRALLAAGFRPIGSEALFV
jgi:GNAT superfamily N-acetyltransferase